MCIFVYSSRFALWHKAPDGGAQCWPSGLFADTSFVLTECIVGHRRRFCRCAAVSCCVCDVLGMIPFSAGQSPLNCNGVLSAPNFRYTQSSVRKVYVVKASHAAICIHPIINCWWRSINLSGNIRCPRQQRVHAPACSNQNNASQYICHWESDFAPAA